MTECRCGEWDKIGHCVKCFEHYADKWDELWEEIESLRSDLEKANERCSQWADIAGAHGAERDEWKRRFFVIWDWMATNFQPWLLEDHPEAKDWVEEE